MKVILVVLGDTMVLDNLAVCHKKFGLGTVVATRGNYMTVRFQNEEKVFVYPDAFEKFLTLADGTVSDEIVADIECAKSRKTAIADAKHRENLRSMTHGIVIPGKENVPEGKENDQYATEPEEI